MTFIKKTLLFIVLLKSASPFNINENFIGDRNQFKHKPTITAKMVCASDTLLTKSTSCEKSDTVMSQYEKLLCRLFTTNLFNVKQEGLKNMDVLHQALGSPMDQGISIVHLAGSNGKGSTALKMANTLQLANHRVGLFSSPHISSFRERIQIDQVPVSEEQIQIHLQEVFDICESKNIPATFFEVVTALAFVIFAQENVDIVVLETGLGGRLDATNVVKHPTLSVITSIGLEHTKILGDTVEQIALEKGGIIKEGCPVLVGNNVPVEVIRNCAKEKNASQFYECDDLLDEESKDNESLAHELDYDAENSRIARAALTILATKNHCTHLSTQQINEGVKIRPTCRFEEMVINTSVSNNSPVKVILDVAHNPQAIQYLIAKLRTNYSSQLRFVVGFSADKDIKSCSEILWDSVSHPNRIHLVESPNPRAASISSILEGNEKLSRCNYEKSSRGKTSSISLQVKGALKLAATNDELLVICGSFFIMADARKELGIEEPRDSAAIGKETAKIIERRKHQTAKK